MVSALEPAKRGVRIHGKEMAYIETGTGDPIVFLHGNPTSSYLWRNVIPHLAPLGRCLAPDLIGMGSSEKLAPSGPDSYRFVEHRRYLDGRRGDGDLPPALPRARRTRRPTLTWPRQIPLDRAPADVTGIVQAYADWLLRSEVPKLFVNAEPGAILVGRQREFCRRWPNQIEITVKGSHFIQEDSPDEIGRAIAAWLLQLS